MALNAICVGVERRDRLLLCIGRRICIFLVLLFSVMMCICSIVVLVQKLHFNISQVMVTSSGCFVGIVGVPPESRLLEFLQRAGEDG